MLIALCASCGPSSALMREDAGEGDAGAVGTDAGTLDGSAGQQDAGPSDGGFDAGAVDAGTVDAGGVDAGSLGWVGGNVARGQHGVWAVWAKPSADSLSFVRGHQAIVNWKDIQTGINSWSWGALDGQMQTFLTNGQSFTVQVNATDPKPGWIWGFVHDAGTVTQCGCYQSGQGATEQIPNYWTESYSYLQQVLIDGLAAHIQSFSYAGRNARDHVLLIRTAPDAIGTEHLNASACTSGPVSASWGTCQGTCGAGACAVPGGSYQSDYMLAQMTRYRDGLWSRYQIPVALRASGSSGITPLLDPRGVWLFSTGTAADAESLEALDIYAISQVRDPTLLTPPQPPRTYAYWEPARIRRTNARPVAISSPVAAVTTTPSRGTIGGCYSSFTRESRGWRSTGMTSSLDPRTPDTRARSTG